MDVGRELEVLVIHQKQQKIIAVPETKEIRKDLPPIQLLHQNEISGPMSKPSPKNDQTSQGLRRNNNRSGRKTLKILDL